MSNSHIENQLCLKGIKSGFTFIFSLKKDNVLVDRLSQSIEYGWEAPNQSGSSGLMSMFMFDTSKPTTQVSFNPDKTDHNIDLQGYIYTQLNRKDESTIIADGSLTDLKLQANTGETWYLIDNRGNKLKGGGKGIWYVKNIRQTASDFITGLNALKISFSITINKYK